MAAPHVAGYAAYLLGLDSSLTPSSVESTIMFNALTNVLSGIRKYRTLRVGMLLFTLLPSRGHRQPPPQPQQPYLNEEA